MLKINEKEGWKKSNKLKNKLALLIIVLLVSLASFVYASITWSDGTKTIFTITDTNPVCINGEYWLTWESGIENRTPSITDCYRDDGWPTPKCCVYGENSCDTSSFPLNPATCTLPAVFECDEYNAENYGSLAGAKEACTNDSYWVGVATIEKKEGAGFCKSRYSEVRVGVTCDWYIYGCRCLWNSADGKCNSNFTKSKWNCHNETQNITAAGNCIVSTEKIDECNATGYITYSWNAEWVGDTEPLPEVCTSDSRKLKCAAKLTFFTIASLIAAIILIILIYIWIKRKAGKHKQIVKRKIRRKKNSRKR